MAANVAVVEIVHSLVERSVKSSIKGCSLCLSLFLFFFFHSKSYMKTHKSRHMEIICFDKWMYAEGSEKMLCFKDGTVTGEFL